ncbi:selenium cofactor biosynthesis protein YqeC [Sporomusa termitida]|uniref:TIGR03172: putative selenium-dependent hydroxylase accessory protein YqeC n=1 Tax=Sporomusa termitida TaxID=2377 RepID=A0A517DXT3_9FIRM|nr:selenium cofactor biosynthesis protein YqeC [Sporomusa termitida]QDR82170.1 TIGR03172: putative selenium-dependent hydroxylase accessory protein YqeC [Sporomusa termitida]
MLWAALGLNRPAVVACVGAGGKTSLIQSLAAGACRRGWPVLVTATTKMFYSQVAGYELVLTEAAATGVAQVAAALQQGQPVGWFARLEGEKVIGVPAGGIDSIAAKAPWANILIEADGARQALLKAPSAREPVIPACTSVTVGIVNLGAVGQPLTAANTHRPELVSGIIGKQAGAAVAWSDIVRLAVHRQGLFQYARGTRVLLLSGAQDPDLRPAGRLIAGDKTLAGAGLARVVLTTGYGCNMQPCEVYLL